MKVESFKIDFWEQPQTGVVLSENSDWILVKHIPADYVLDGYKLFRKEFVLKRINSAKEKQIERVLKLRKIEIDMPVDFEFLDTIGVLKWSQDKFGLFEFQDEYETELFYGRINVVEGNDLIIDSIDTKGKVEEAYDFPFQIDEITTIAFQSDYFESIRALWMHKNKINFKPTP